MGLRGEPGRAGDIGKTGPMVRRTKAKTGHKDLLETQN